MGGLTHSPMAVLRYTAAIVRYQEGQATEPWASSSINVGREEIVAALLGICFWLSSAYMLWKTV